MPDFWKNWLLLWGWFVVLFGAVLAGAAFEATDGGARLLYGLLDGPGDSRFDPHLRFATGLMGAVTLGWGLTFIATFKAAFALGAQAGPVWRALTNAALVWYVIDSAISVGTGFWLNAVSNTVLIAALLIPLLKSGVLRN